jgi:hypothetical protein
LKVYAALKEKYPELYEVAIYGELFGGKQPLSKYILPELNLIKLASYLAVNMQVVNVVLYSLGIYPHKDVPGGQGLKSESGRCLHVQRDIYYSPDIRFYAFDIAIPGKG